MLILVISVPEIWVRLQNGPKWFRDLDAVDALWPLFQYPSQCEPVAGSELHDRWSLIHWRRRFLFETGWIIGELMQPILSSSHLESCLDTWEELLDQVHAAQRVCILRHLPGEPPRDAPSRRPHDVGWNKAKEDVEDPAHNAFNQFSSPPYWLLTIDMGIGGP